MLEQMPGIHMYAQWKLIWEKYRHILKPNRKSPIELLNYVSRRYCLTEIHEQAALDTVRLNILMNEPLAQKLPKNSAPEPRTFYIEDVGNGKDLYTLQSTKGQRSRIFFGIDMITGYFIVEGCSRLWDELYAFRGLDEDDLENPYCVAEYINCLEAFGMLEDTLRNNK